MDLVQGNLPINYLMVEDKLFSALMKLQAARDMIADHETDFKIMAAIRAIEEVRSAALTSAGREAAI